MNFAKFSQLLVCVLLCCLTGCGDSHEKSTPADTRRASDIVNALRLKKLTAGLELTSNQQAKVKELLDTEAVQVEKIHREAARNDSAQAVQLINARKNTYEQIKPLLTPVQLEKFDRIVNKMEGRKTTN